VLVAAQVRAARTVEFEPGAAYLYNFYTVPELRNKGIYQALLGEILQKRFAEGAPRTYITAAIPTFRRAVEHVGFQLTATDTHTRLLHEMDGRHR
jgi:GNAT superfamily N-acetyltransferase